MSSDAMSLAVGLLLGVLAMLPGAMLAAAYRGQERRDEAQPPVEVHYHIHVAERSAVRRSGHGRAVETRDRCGEQSPAAVDRPRH
jgi:hypothetical protein